MKICHITSVHDYKDTRINLKECMSLLEISQQVHLIATNDEDIMLNGITIHGIKRVRQSRVKRILSSTREFYNKTLEVDADVYHFHDPELIRLGKKLIKKGKKVIYDVHEDVPRQIMTKHWIPKFLRGFVSSIYESYENRAARKFTAIVTATPFIKERFIKINQNTVDIKNYPILKEMYLPSVADMKKENIVTYIGGISKKRGIFTTLQAFEKLEGISFKLAGSFLSSEELERAKKLNAWNKVNYVGFIDREGIRTLLNKSKVGLVVLHPEVNYIDSLPIKMFEYMAAGIPVIASNFPLWEEIIKENHCGICVDPLNTSEIASAIQWIVDNPKEAKVMGANGRKAIEEKYNWEAESKRLIDLYNNL